MEIIDKSKDIEQAMADCGQHVVESVDAMLKRENEAAIDLASLAYRTACCGDSAMAALATAVSHHILGGTFDREKFNRVLDLLMLTRPASLEPASQELISQSA